MNQAAELANNVVAIFSAIGLLFAALVGCVVYIIRLEGTVKIQGTELKFLKEIYTGHREDQKSEIEDVVDNLGSFQKKLEDISTVVHEIRGQLMMVVNNGR